MRRPGGATNKEICAMTGFECSWAIDGRRWAERYGLEFFNTRVQGPKGNKLALYQLTGALPGEGRTAAPAID
jgi:hypothetical protein